MRDGEPNEGRGQFGKVHEGYLNEGRGHDSNVNNKVNVSVMNEGDIVGFESEDDIDDMSFNYNSALNIAFDDSNDDFMEEEMDNMLYYGNGYESTSIKHKHNGEIDESEDDGYELENGCETYENIITSRKKKPIFKLQKYMANYRWDLGTYFTFKCDFKETITIRSNPYLLVVLFS